MPARGRSTNSQGQEQLIVMREESWSKSRTENRSCLPETTVCIIQSVFNRWRWSCQGREAPSHTCVLGIRERGVPRAVTLGDLFAYVTTSVSDPACEWTGRTRRPWWAATLGLWWLMHPQNALKMTMMLPVMERSPVDETCLPVVRHVNWPMRTVNMSGQEKQEYLPQCTWSRTFVAASLKGRSICDSHLHLYVFVSAAVPCKIDPVDGECMPWWLLLSLSLSLPRRLESSEIETSVIYIHLTLKITEFH